MFHRGTPHGVPPGCSSKVLRELWACRAPSRHMAGAVAALSGSRYRSRCVRARRRRDSARVRCHSLPLCARCCAQVKAAACVRAPFRSCFDSAPSNKKTFLNPLSWRWTPCGTGSLRCAGAAGGSSLAGRALCVHEADFYGFLAAPHHVECSNPKRVHLARNRTGPRDNALPAEHRPPAYCCMLLHHRRQLQAGRKGGRASTVHETGFLNDFTDVFDF